MKRHDALIPLSHDHQNALARALRLRRAAELNLDGRRDGAAAFLDFAGSRLVPHFQEEEALLTRAAEHVESGPLAEAHERLQREHRQLRERFEVLRAAVTDPDLLDGELLYGIGQQLTDHIRFEERELFELLQRELGDELHELAGAPGERDG